MPMHCSVYPKLAAPAWRSAALALVFVATTVPGFAATPATPPAAATAVDAPYGWPWLRRALDSVRPAADTRLPESATQVAERLESQIDRGDAAAALVELDRRLAERAASPISGTDVRLVFLRARALAALGRLPEATAAYRQMTIEYPELPEPWNNLAVVLVAQGQLDPAHDALQMALRTQPNYAAAQANLGDVLLLQAERAYARALELGARQVQPQLQRLRPLLSSGAQP